MQSCGRYLKEKLPFSLISSSFFHFTPHRLQQLCAGHDTHFGPMEMDSEGLRSFSLHRGNPKVRQLCFPSAGKPEFAPQHLKMLLSWMGLSVAFLVVGSLPTGASGWLYWE